MKKFLLSVVLLGGMLVMPMRADVYTDGLNQLVSLGTSSLDVESMIKSIGSSDMDVDAGTYETMKNGLVEIIAPYYREALNEELFDEYIRFYSQPDIVELTKKNAIATAIMKETNHTTLMTAMMRLTAGGQPIDVTPTPCSQEYEVAFTRYWNMNDMDNMINSTFDMLTMTLEEQNPKMKPLLDQLIPYMKRNYKTANRNALLSVMTEQELQRYTSVVEMPFYEPSRQVSAKMTAGLPNFLEKVVMLMTPKEEIPAQPKVEFAETNEVFVVVEEMPQYPGGYAKANQYISENTHYPKAALKAGAEGRVICQFIVEKDGSFSDVDIVRSSGNSDLDAEAIRVVRSMPHWTPGKQRGKAVRVRYTIPVTFKLPKKQ